MPCHAVLDVLLQGLCEDHAIQPTHIIKSSSLVHYFYGFIELSQNVADLEAAAVYSDAKAQHEQHMAELNKAIAGVQQEVQHVNSDIR